ncbi:unnamed protein product [Orchesella dallaii]|uniref:Uncharacterized protein n=1 Tax=Orchesella dallaii TaxID=48710 RepID=A0ABP1R6M3_9HEXA
MKTADEDVLVKVFFSSTTTHPVPCHTGRKVKAALKPTGLAELVQPPYSPDLAPSGLLFIPADEENIEGKEISVRLWGDCSGARLPVPSAC